MNPECPACATATRLVQFTDVAGFRCENCAGHFIRGSALESFLTGRDAPGRFFDLMRQAGDAPRSGRALTCPDCRTRSFCVVRTCFVEVEVCSTCVGLYLDKGEADIYVLRTRASTRVLEQLSDAIEDLLDEILGMTGD